MGEERGTKIRPLVTHATNPSFSVPHSYTSAITASLIPSTPFPNSNATLPSLHTPPYSSSHPPLLPFYSPLLPVHTDSSQILHVTNKCSTSCPAPLPHITHLIYNLKSQFLSSSNPAKPVLRLVGVLGYYYYNFFNYYYRT